MHNIRVKISKKLKDHRNVPYILIKYINIYFIIYYKIYKYFINIYLCI